MANEKEHPEFQVIDVTLAANKLFSVIIELRERYGIFYCIDVVRGSTSGIIRQEHKDLECFGSGREWTRTQWTELATDLIIQGFLERSTGSYPTTRLTELAVRVLRGERRIFVARNVSALQPPERSPHTSLYAQLRELRERLAADAKVVPYIVLPEAALVELATFLPTTLENLERIKGFGRARIQRFGEAFLEVIRDYCSRNDLKPSFPGKPEREKPVASREKTLQLFQAGQTIEQVAEERELSIRTIESHLEFYISNGSLLLEQVMDAEKVDSIKGAIRSIGNSVSAIRQILGYSVSEREIRFVMAHIQSQVGEPWEFSTYYHLEDSALVLD